MSDQLVAPQEVSDPDSLRDVLLFCGVLLVEIYSLSVALGGPFLEVGYFLLVVISQTIAGAYIWAWLREHERILPLPELLAMGFAIGSASAAISQLIIRDLLGIRLFLSPLVPVIAVIIWRTLKKNPQLPVQISHAKTNTLLWLLFPAPLALLNSSLVISIIFIAPLLLLVRHIYYQSGSSDRLSLPTVSKLSVLMIVTSLVHKIIFSSLTKNGSGISRIISDDLRTDIAQSIGFAKWGITTNAELSDQPLAYYKFSHLWMGPLFKEDGSLAINLCATVLPIFLLAMIGLALWTLTYKMALSLSVAGLGSIIFFTQANLSNSIEINMRAGWLLGAFYLIVYGAIAQSSVSQKSIRSKILLIICGFVLTGTRLSILPFALAISNIPNATNSLAKQRKWLAFIRSQAVLIVTLVSGAFIAFLVFVPNNQSTILDNLIIDASVWPIQIGTSLTFVIKSTLGRTFLFLGMIAVMPKFKNLRFFTTLALSVFLISQLFIPRIGNEDSTFLFPLLLIFSPIFAFMMANSWVSLKVTSSQTRNIIILGISVGFIHKIIFNLLRENQPDHGLLRRAITSFILNEVLMTVSMFCCCTLISYYLLRRSNSLFPSAFVSVILLLGTMSNTGVLVGNHTRPILEYIRYDEKIWGGETDPLVSRWSDVPLLEGLSHVYSLSDDDDITASNFGLSRGIGFEDNLRLQLSINRQVYISGRYLYFRRSFPLIFKQNYGSLSERERDSIYLGELIKTRIDTSIYFPTNPSRLLLENLQKANVKWFVIDLGNTPLRDWEPWATTRFMNEKVAILELSQAVKNTD